MKLTIDKITKILVEAKSKKLDVSMKDILYVIGAQFFDDEKIVFNTLFKGTNNEPDFVEYKFSEKMQFVTKAVEEELKSHETPKNSSKKNEDDISFEENKAYMLNIKKQTEEAMAKGDIDKKDGLKILADITTRLNDKFKVVDTQEEQRVIVNAKYNHICEWTRKECFLQTKEYAMEKWNLVEKEGGV